jgi:hypothetical protein
MSTDDNIIDGYSELMKEMKNNCDFNDDFATQYFVQKEALSTLGREIPEDRIEDFIEQNDLSVSVEMGFHYADFDEIKRLVNCEKTQHNAMSF